MKKLAFVLAALAIIAIGSLANTSPAAACDGANCSGGASTSPP